MATVAIIDYGMGNLHSIAKALERVGDNTFVKVSDDSKVILKADRVVFPGVGAIGHCMNELRRLEMDSVIRSVAQSRPVLGICLGMQALLGFSEENDGTDCLGLFEGSVRHFPGTLHDASSGSSLKVPHMGWNQIHQELEHPLWDNIPQDSRFYFVHSYYADPADPGQVAGSTSYGVRFASVLARDNLFALQCHPEKSQHVGLKLLENFLRWDGQS